MKLTVVDVLVFVYVLYGLISGVFVTELPCSGYFYIKWIVIIVVYLFVRIIPNKTLPFYSLNGATDLWVGFKEDEDGNEISEGVYKNDYYLSMTNDSIFNDSKIGSTKG